MQNSEFFLKSAPEYLLIFQRFFEIWFLSFQNSVQPWILVAWTQEIWNLQQISNKGVDFLRCAVIYLAGLEIWNVTQISRVLPPWGKYCSTRVENWSNRQISRVVNIHKCRGRSALKSEISRRFQRTQHRDICLPDQELEICLRLENSFVALKTVSLPWNLLSSFDCNQYDAETVAGNGEQMSKFPRFQISKPLPVSGQGVARFT